MTDIARVPRQRGTPSTDHRADPTPPGPVELAEVDAQVLVTFAAMAVGHFHHDVHCGLSLGRRDRAPQTLAATDELPVRADWLQHQLQQGPCVGPVSRQLLISRDLAADPRWPDFGRMCTAALDLRGLVMLRIPLAAGLWAALAFYSSDPETVDHLDVDAAARLVPLAAASARELVRTFGDPIEQASTAEVDRIALACAILGDRHQMSPAEAFGLLLRRGRDQGRTPLEVALDVIASGELDPEPTTRAGRSARARHLRVGGPEMWHEWSRPA